MTGYYVGGEGMRSDHVASRGEGFRFRGYFEGSRVVDSHFEEGGEMETDCSNLENWTGEVLQYVKSSA